jgi:hypothetical protein
VIQPPVFSRPSPVLEAARRRPTLVTARPSPRLVFVGAPSWSSSSWNRPPPPRIGRLRLVLESESAASASSIWWPPPSWPDLRNRASLLSGTRSPCPRPRSPHPSPTSGLVPVAPSPGLGLRNLTTRIGHPLLGSAASCLDQASLLGSRPNRPRSVS